MSVARLTIDVDNQAGVSIELLRSDSGGDTPMWGLPNARPPRFPSATFHSTRLQFGL
jgi:hypothetical protein